MFPEHKNNPLTHNTMKTKTTITEISHEDLVNLICTACYSNYRMDFSYNKKGYEHLMSEDDCAEDEAAKILLAGGKIEITDAEAEDADDLYGDKGYWDEQYQLGCYPISLDDIKTGLQNAFDGTFKVNVDGEADWLRECAQHLIEDAGDMDLPEAMPSCK